MMKKILYIIAAGAMLLASCSKENSSPETDRTAVRFTTEIATRASGTAWEANDQIGVFMKTAGGDISTSEGLNASNVNYTTTDGTNFTTTTPIYYPQSGNVGFVAYYPYRTKPAPDPYIYKVDVTAQTTPADIDLLWSANATNVARSKTAVALQFDHKLSRMVLNITKGEGMTDADLSGMEVRIAGMPTKADFKLADGTFNTPTDIANLTPRTVTAGTRYEAIVIPQAGTTGRKMVFMVGADVYEYAIPDADDFVSGKNYPYTVTVSKTGVSVSRGTITDWTGTGSSENVVAEQMPIPMVLIPAGTFMMGSSDGSNIGDLDGSGLNTSTAEPNRKTNETQHKVTLSKDFYMSKYTITFAQYDAFCDAENKTKPFDETWGRGDRPVINVSRHDAVAYCAWLSQATGFTYRLPTEAEWEYACRGAYTDKATETATLPFAIGDGTKLYADMANFNGVYPYVLPGGHIDNFAGDANHPNTYLGKTQPVGSYTANSYGLYDMHGNVWEWCSDWYAVYDTNAATDPIGPDTGYFCVLRGGSWGNYAQDCRSAYRNNSHPDNGNNNVGFRVVFVP